MPSIAEVFVTVFPSEPVDTTSPYKNVLRPALAADGLPASRPRDYRTGWYPRTRRSRRSRGSSSACWRSPPSSSVCGDRRVCWESKRPGRRETMPPIQSHQDEILSRPRPVRGCRNNYVGLPPHH